MTEDNKSNNSLMLIAGIGIALLFAYLIIKDSHKTILQVSQNLPYQTLPNYNTTNDNQLQQLQLQTQYLTDKIDLMYNQQIQQSNSITQLENTKCASSVIMPSETPPTEIPLPESQPGSDMSANEISMPKRISNINMSNTTREIEELYANRYFGMT